MNDEQQLIETIREEWAPETPHPGPFQAGIERRLRTRRGRRVAVLTLAAVGAAAAATLIALPLMPTEPALESAPTEVVLELDVQVSSTELEKVLPPEYATLSALFIEPLDTEGT